MTERAQPVHWPAEWEPHRGTLLTWPHNRGTWPDDVEALETAFTQAITALAADEVVFLAVADEATAAQVRARFVADGVAVQAEGELSPRGIRLLRVRTNDSWVRDYGPIFVRDGARGDALVGLDFRFNAWGGKYPPWNRDDAAGDKLCRAIGAAVRRREFVLEGGAVEGNGAGLLLTTEACLLNPSRNGEMDRSAVEAELATSLGARKVVWLGGGVVGDDTDGHIDNLARFVAPRTVIALTEPDALDVNHAPLADNLARLRAFRDDDGSALHVIELPEPEPLSFDGARLPASYANFYIGNAVVLLPSFGGARDAQAQRIVQDAFPNRRVVPVDARVVVRGFGAWHCLTQQVPA